MRAHTVSAAPCGCLAWRGAGPNVLTDACPEHAIMLAVAEYADPPLGIAAHAPAWHAEPWRYGPVAWDEADRPIRRRRLLLAHRTREQADADAYRRRQAVAVQQAGTPPTVEAITNALGRARAT